MGRRSKHQSRLAFFWYCFMVILLLPRCYRHRHNVTVKTTFDLPDTLLRRAKRKALETNTTLKALVISGLKRELQTSGPIHADPIAHLKTTDPSIWRGVKADAYVRELRKGWK